MEYINDKINTIIHKDNSIKKLNTTLQKHILNDDYKTANLLAYWINDFVRYHVKENNYINSNQKVYKRGNIIKANLGFNIGNELRRITLLYCS